MDLMNNFERKTETPKQNHTRKIYSFHFTPMPMMNEFMHVLIGCFAS